MRNLARRRPAGAAMGLVAVCLFVFATLVVGFFHLSLYFGASREMRNAVDAGALNVGKEVFTEKSLKLDLPAAGAKGQFKDVTDKHGEVGLANINYVWGKALLAEANAEAMNSAAQGGSSKAHADELFEAAKEINNELAEKLNNENNLYPLFEQITSQNSMRMLGIGTQAKALKQGNFWQTSLLDRGKETNIEVTTSSILPSASSYNALGVIQSLKRLPGYKPIVAGGRQFCFVPFVDKERTQLVSKSTFDDNSATAKPIVGPEAEIVPNTFSCKGDTAGMALQGQEGMAFVLANPQRLYKLSMPHTFIHIKVEDNKLTWLLNSPAPELGQHKVAVEQYEENYDFKLQLKGRSGTSVSAICGTLLAQNVPIGKEYTVPSLDTALFGSMLEVGDRGKLENALVQRINEIISEPGVTYTVAQLHTLLGGGQTGGWLQSGERDFYIFSTDGKNIDVGPSAYAIAHTQDHWIAPLINHVADGTEKETLDITSHTPIALIVQVIPDPFCSPYFPPFGDIVVNVTDQWQPGSGYDGCLGTVRVKHQTNVYLWGIAGPF